MEYTTKTLKQIIAENENIFNKASNPIKQRHGGLTIKLSKNGEKYKYNVVTILGSEKVIDTTKKIIDFKKQQWAIIKENNSLQNEENEINVTLNEQNEEMESLNKELTQATHKAYTSENNEEKIESLRKKNFLEKEILDKTKYNDRIRTRIAEIKEKIQLNNSKLQKLKSDTETFEQIKLNIINQEWKTKSFFERTKAHLKLIKLWDNESHHDYIKMQSVDRMTKINKKLKLQEQLLSKTQNSHMLELNSIIKNQLELEKEKEKEINSRNKIIKRIDEEIFLINNKIYFTTTFVHADQSITEKIMFFMENFKNKELELFKQINAYKDMDEYKSNTSLIQRNLPYEKIPLKEFINEQIKLKSKPSKTEITLWIVITLFTISLAIIPAVIPFIWPATVLVLTEKLIIGACAVTFVTSLKMFTSMFSTATKKVELWFYNKWFKNQEKKEKNKKECKTILKDLNSDKLETKLETQYNIFEAELNIRKPWKINKLWNETNIQINKTNEINCSNKESTLNVEEINSKKLESTQLSRSTNSFSL